MYVWEGLGASGSVLAQINHDIIVASYIATTLQPHKYMQIDHIF